MAEDELIQKIKALPPDLKQQVELFVDFVWEKNLGHQLNLSGRGRLFGLLKGKLWMSPDFDEPLEDMKEYM